MLSSLEMISEPSGKTKTLADLIKEGSILTPETPVYTSDDSMELEDYVKSLIPEPPAPGLDDWEKVGEIENLVFNTLTNIDATLNDIFDGKYTDLLLMMAPADSTYDYPIATMIIPGDYLKNNEEWFMFFSTANTAQAIGQSALVYGFQFTEAAGVHKVIYKGANHFYNNGTKLTITFYAR